MTTRHVRKMFTYPPGGLGNLLKEDIKPSRFSKMMKMLSTARDGNCYVKLRTTDRTEIQFQRKKDTVRQVKRSILYGQQNADNVNSATHSSSTREYKRRTKLPRQPAEECEQARPRRKNAHMQRTKRKTTSPSGQGNVKPSFDK